MYMISMISTLGLLRPKIPKLCRVTYYYYIAAQVYYNIRHRVVTYHTFMRSVTHSASHDSQAPIFIANFRPFGLSDYRRLNYTGNPSRYYTRISNLPFKSAHSQLQLIVGCGVASQSDCETFPALLYCNHSNSK